MLPLSHRHTIVGLDAMLASSDYAWEGLALGAGSDGGFAPEGLGQFFYECVPRSFSSRSAPVERNVLILQFHVQDDFQRRPHRTPHPCLSCCTHFVPSHLSFLSRFVLAVLARAFHSGFIDV